MEYPEGPNMDGLGNMITFRRRSFDVRLLCYPSSSFLHPPGALWEHVVASQGNNSGADDDEVAALTLIVPQRVSFPGTIMTTT